MEKFVVNLSIGVRGRSWKQTPVLKSLEILGKSREEGRPFQVTLVPRISSRSENTWRGHTNIYYYCENLDYEKSTVIFDDSQIVTLNDTDVLLRDFTEVKRIVISGHFVGSDNDYTISCILVPAIDNSRARTVRAGNAKVVVEEKTGEST